MLLCLWLCLCECLPWALRIRHADWKIIVNNEAEIMKSSIAISKLNASWADYRHWLSLVCAFSLQHRQTHKLTQTHTYIRVCKERQNTEVGTEWEQKYWCSLHASARGREHICMYSGQNIDFPTSFLLHFRKWLNNQHSAKCKLQLPPFSRFTFYN